MHRTLLNTRPNTLSDFVIKALAAHRQEEAVFTDEVVALQKLVSNRLQLPVRHERDMNCCAGQSLRFEVRAKHSDARKQRLGALFEVMLFLSKGRVNAWYVFDRQGAIVKSRFPSLAPELRPDSVRQAVTSVQPLLERAEWKDVSFAFLNVLAPNCTTELDNQPATVFEALFAEIT
jgi:hypothetical protein